MSFVSSEGEQDLLFRLFEVVVFHLDGLYGSQGLNVFALSRFLSNYIWDTDCAIYATNLNQDERTGKEGVTHWSSEIVLRYTYTHFTKSTRGPYVVLKFFSIMKRYAKGKAVVCCPE